MGAIIIGDTSYLVEHEDRPDAALLQYPSAERIEKLRAMKYADYLHTPEWQEKRRIEIQAAEYKCHRCCARGRTLDVHHLTYERRGCEQPEDLEVLCRECHAHEHGL